MKIKTGLLIGMIAWGLAGSGIQEAAANGQICPDGSTPTENNPCATIFVCPSGTLLCPNGTCATNIASCPTESNATTSTSGYTTMKRCYVDCRARGGKKCIKPRTGQFKCVGGKIPPR